MSSLLPLTSITNILRGGSWESYFNVPTYEPSAPSSSTVTNTYNQQNNLQQGGNVQAANGSLIGGGVSITNNPYQYGINFAGGLPAKEIARSPFRLAGCPYIPECEALASKESHGLPLENLSLLGNGLNNSPQGRPAAGIP
jgi:hypothetical protein